MRGELAHRLPVQQGPVADSRDAHPGEGCVRWRRRYREDVDRELHGIEKRRDDVGVMQIDGIDAVGTRVDVLAGPRNGVLEQCGRLLLAADR